MEIRRPPRRSSRAARCRSSSSSRTPASPRGTRAGRIRSTSPITGSMAARRSFGMERATHCRTTSGRARRWRSRSRCARRRRRARTRSRGTWSRKAWAGSATTPCPCARRTSSRCRRTSRCTARAGVTASASRSGARRDGPRVRWVGPSPASRSSRTTSRSRRSARSRRRSRSAFCSRTRPPVASVARSSARRR